MFRIGFQSAIILITIVLGRVAFSEDAPSTNLVNLREDPLVASDKPSVLQFRLGQINNKNTALFAFIDGKQIGQVSPDSTGLVSTSVLLSQSGTHSFSVADATSNILGTSEFIVRPSEASVMSLAAANCIARAADGLVVPTIQVTVTDKFGNPIPDLSCNVSVEKNTHGVQPATRKTSSNGVALFDDLQVRGPSGESQVTFTTIVGSKTTNITVQRNPVAHILIDQEDIVARAGEMFTLVVETKDARRDPVANANVDVFSSEGNVSVVTKPAISSGAGIAIVAMALKGRPQVCKIRIQSDDADTTIQIRLEKGGARQIVVLRSPGPLIVSGRKFADNPMVRVIDGAGNPVASEEVMAQLEEWSKKDGRFEVSDNGSLQGNLQAKSDDTGNAEFRDVGFFGEDDKYRLRFFLTADTSVYAFSNRISYDPRRQLNRSTVIVSAIKSLAGTIPDDEFFDIRFRTRIATAAGASVMAGSDIALSNRDTDSLSSNQKSLTEAYVMANCDFRPVARRGDDFPERVVFLGLSGRVFDTLPYAGVHIGGIEADGSPFHGSSFSFAYLWAIDPRTVVIGDEKRVVESARTSFFFDFFVRSSTIDFFKKLTIRGGILIPCKKDAYISSRIAIAIPVETLEVF